MAGMPTPEEIAYMTAHINDTLVPDIIACSAICAGFSVIILALRIYSRYQTIRKLVLSDWMVVASVIFFIAFCVIFAGSTMYGAGRHIILITDPEDIRMLAIFNILNPILYGVATMFVKLSILALYISIFPQKGFRIYVYIIAAINVANTIAIVLVSCLQCRPLEKLWTMGLEGVCIDFSIFSLFNSSFNFIIDIVILVSPLPLVMKLQLSKRKKYLLAINFALGGGACVVAIIRLPFAKKVGGTANPSWDMIPGGLLCVVEVAVALLCASLPVYRPLFRRYLPGLTTTAESKYGRGNSHGTSDFLGSNVSTRIVGGGSRGTRRTGIAVTDDISMMTHHNVNGKWVRVNDDDDEAGLVRPKPSHSGSQTSSN